MNRAKWAIWVMSVIVIAPNAWASGHAAEETESADITFHSSEAMRRADFPLSNAVEVNGLVFLSGVLGSVPGQGMVEGGIGPETHQTMKNIEARLADLGLGMDRIVKCTAFLADMAEWPAFNEVYKQYFDGNYPARSALGVSGLAANGRVEVECIAHR